MKKTFIENISDMQWLRETHLPKLDKVFDHGSAMLFGNEDLPSKIYVYKDKAPLVTDDPLIFTLDSETWDYTGTAWE